MRYQSIDAAPKDGTIVRVKLTNGVGSDVWSFRSKWIDGRWCGDFGIGDVEDWRPVDPQPMFWRPI